MNNDKVDPVLIDLVTRIAPRLRQYDFVGLQLRFAADLKGFVSHVFNGNAAK
jgi:hypothetical protein